MLLLTFFLLLQSQAGAPPAAIPTSSPKCSISFLDKARPSRVDNAAKACLDDIAMSLKRDPESRLVMIGAASLHESQPGVIAAQRAVNAKSYLVRDQGIDSTRITVMATDTASEDRVTDYLVPQGAAFAPPQGAKPIKENGSKPQSRR